MNKLCPLFLMAAIANNARHIPNQERAIEVLRCRNSLCELWTDSYTIEGMSIQGCAIRINAMKGQDGRVIV